MLKATNSVTVGEQPIYVFAAALPFDRVLEAIGATSSTATGGTAELEEALAEAGCLATVGFASTHRHTMQGRAFRLRGKHDCNWGNVGRSLGTANKHAPIDRSFSSLTPS